MYFISCEEELIIKVHSHETVWSVKQKIASLLRVNAEQIMLVIGDRPSPLGNSVMEEEKTLYNKFSSMMTRSGTKIIKSTGLY